MTSYDAQVIVVGGGPGGASAAWHLATLGLDVLVLDRARFPRDKTCAEYLSPEASRLLSALGALDAAEAAGAAQLGGMLVRAPSGDVIAGHFAAGHGFRGFRDRGLAIRRRVLDALLLERAKAAGARVVEDAHVVDLARDGRGAVEGVVVRGALDGGRTLRAPLVVGADGLRSVVGRRLGRHAAVAVAAARGVPVPRARARDAARRPRRGAHARPMGEMHAEADGSYVGIAHVDGGLTNVAMVAPAPRRGAGSPSTGRRPPTSTRGCGGAAARGPWAAAERAGRCGARGRSPATRARVGARARRSSATRPTSSTRSPARGSTARCWAASWSRRTRPRRRAPAWAAAAPPPSGRWAATSAPGGRPSAASGGWSGASGSRSRARRS
jgi:hypothetical protein